MVHTSDPCNKGQAEPSHTEVCTNPDHSGNSSFVSVEEHYQLTTTTLMQRDAPHWSVFDKDDDIISIHEDGQSNVEMVYAIGQPEQHTEDSSVDSAAGDSDHCSNLTKTQPPAITQTQPLTMA